MHGFGAARVVVVGDGFQLASGIAETGQVSEADSLKSKLQRGRKHAEAILLTLRRKLIEDASSKYFVGQETYSNAKAEMDAHCDSI